MQIQCFTLENNVMFSLSENVDANECFQEEEKVVVCADW